MKKEQQEQKIGWFRRKKVLLKFMKNVWNESIKITQENKFLLSQVFFSTTAAWKSFLGRNEEKKTEKKILIRKSIE